MVGKRSSKAIAREEGLERQDNNMGLTSWPIIPPINQKNYYTDYLKRDDQYLAFRLQNDEARNTMTKKAKDRDRALAGVTKTEDGGAPATEEQEADVGDETMMDDGDGEDQDQEEELPGSKVIVIHIGSQNMRVGLSSDALPKSVPMVIARKSLTNESEEDGGEPHPKRVKLDGDDYIAPEKAFGDEFAKEYTSMSADLKTRMRANKRRVLPNSKEMVINYNRRTDADIITEHNDPLRIEWTELPADPKAAPEFFTGTDALRIPDDSKPRYKLYWPIKCGWPNEAAYRTKFALYQDISIIIEEAIKKELGLARKQDWTQYGCVFVIPDLYERNVVTQVLDILMREFNFGRVCFIQESEAAAFGGGFSTACIVDIGAEKTSICCVDEGQCVENSRINLKYGGRDVTQAFIKMMLYDHFPYDEINLRMRYDFLLAEELKTKYCTLNESDVSVSLFDFHRRASGQDTRKYTFKAYDEVFLAPLGFFRPSIFENEGKLIGRRKLIEQSYDLYDGEPNDPVSTAQLEILQNIKPAPVLTNGDANGTTSFDPMSTPARGILNPVSRFQELDATPRSSVAGSPAPDGANTPLPYGTSTPGPNGAAAKEAAAHLQAANASHRDDVLPIFPLDQAIRLSVIHASRGDERKVRDFMGGIMVLGGGSQTPGLHTFLEEKMQQNRLPGTKEILIGAPPRELDAQVVSWKGASVFGKLAQTNDSWINQFEYDRLGARVITNKVMWAW